MSPDDASKAPSPPNPAEGTGGPPKWLIEYGPLLVFLALFKLKGIYWATGGFMVALALAMAASYVVHKKLPPTLIFTGAIVLPLGALTIYLHDARFIYMKPTIVSIVSAVVLLGGLARGKALLKPLLGAQLPMKDEGWRALSLRFAFFSLVLGAANEFVWRSVTPDREHLWVLFKFPGIPVLTAMFLMTQMRMIKRFELPPAE
jgi:intracellular septation protein